MSTTAGKGTAPGGNPGVAAGANGGSNAVCISHSATSLMSTEAFLRLLYGDAPRAFLYLWTPDKRLRWFLTTDLAAMAREAERLSKSDLFYGVGIQPTPQGGAARGTEEHITGIPGFWTDIDIKSASHSSPKLPPTIDDALALLAEFPLRPTAIVLTGHGLHAYWLLKEFWTFDDEAERHAAKDLSKRLQATIRAKAAAHDWTVDPTADLSRVLRVPGSTNCKDAQNPASVRVIHVDDICRYDPSDIEPLMLERPTGEKCDTSGLRADYGPRPAIGPILGACAWLRHCRDDAASLSEPAWYAMLSIVGRCENGEELAHEWSAAYPRYDYAETMQKLAHALEDAGPRTCERIREDLDGEEFCEKCSAWGKATTPLFFGASASQATPAEIGLTKRLADAILTTDHFAVDAGGRLYIYSQGVYVPTGDKHIERRVKALLEEWRRTKSWSSYRASEVAKYIAADAPTLWERPPLDLVNLKNGLLDLNTRELREHSPGYLSPVQLAVAYDSTATCEEWDRFNKSTFPEDTRELIFELLALLMAPDTSGQKAILAIGEGNNGKSTWLAAVIAFLGRHNTASLSLHKLETDRFAAARLVGKLANICPDLPSSHLTSTSTFKSATGGDPITAEYKYRDSFDFVPFARLVFSANTPPRSDDASHAFFRRWAVVPFSNSFEGDCAIPRNVLDAKLADPGQLSGALNKALAALDRVRTHGITETESMREAWQEFRETTDPLAVWLDRETVEDPAVVVPSRDLLNAYNQSIAAEGKPGMTGKAFGQALKRLRPKIDNKQRTIAEKTVWCYVGIGLKAKPPTSARSRDHAINAIPLLFESVFV